MILFYSNHCNASQMLMDQLERYKAKKYFKLINIEKLLSKGMKVPSVVHVVPALMMLPSKKVLIGKQLFDYLLLPNKGFIFTIEQNKINTESRQITDKLIDDNPIAFGFINNASGDYFTYIEDASGDINDQHKQYNWASIDEKITIKTPKEDDYITEDKSNRKPKMPDLSVLQSERALDIQNHLNNTTLPPASTEC
uniref:Uncharacterized protein n=1 Tax=viral metagenome TaxID=1070528 RepID=A0A6C0CRU3_9ZZZZ